MIKELIKLKEKYELDDGITELVYHFNRLGLKTLFSCQGHDWYKKPYIMFQCEEDNLHKIILTLYKMFSEKNTHLDIGTFYKMCEPMISEDHTIAINGNWMWKGNLWNFEDYQKNIDIFSEYMKKL